MAGQVPEPSELVYTPGDSWAPVLVAAGLAILLAGIYAAWWWAAVGALILLAGARVWWRQSDDEVARMRREQRTSTAVIPAEPIRRR